MFLSLRCLGVKVLTYECQFQAEIGKFIEAGALRGDQFLK